MPPLVPSPRRRRRQKALTVKGQGLFFDPSAATTAVHPDSQYTKPAEKCIGPQNGDFTAFKGRTVLSNLSL